MKYFLDYGAASLNKYGEVVCGDVTRIKKKADAFEMVLSDGLGSGIHANILASLTATIVSTMIDDNSALHDIMDTLANTLPIDKEKKIAYSTFTILKLDESDKVNIIEYDNPKIISIRNNKLVKLAPVINIINKKTINIYHTPVKLNDIFIIFSDGLIGAGEEKIFNKNWLWDNIASYSEILSVKEKSAQKIANILVTVTNNFYTEKPVDDLTAVVLKIRKPEKVNVLICPPKNRDDDVWVVNKFINSKGKKIVCGGSTSQMVSRVLQREIKTYDDKIYDANIPPISHIKGIDLVTEGLLTVDKTYHIINSIKYDCLNNINFNKQDAATLLSKMLYDDSTDIEFFVGTSVNAGHINFKPKILIINQLIKLLKKCGKNVKVNYY